MMTVQYKMKNENVGPICRCNAPSMTTITGTTKQEIRAGLFYFARSNVLHGRAGCLDGRMEKMKAAGWAAAAGAPDKQLAIPREDQRPQSATQSADGEQFLLRGHVPELERAVITVAGQGLSVGAERDRKKALFMPGAGAEQSAALNFPQTNRIILAGHGKYAAVWGKGRWNCRSRYWKSKLFLGNNIGPEREGGGIPELNGIPMTVGCDQAPIRGKKDPVPLHSPERTRPSPQVRAAKSQILVAMSNQCLAVRRERQQGDSRIRNFESRRFMG